MQQTKGYFNPKLRLVDTRNRDGETPLLRAATTGVISVIKVRGCGAHPGNHFLTTSHRLFWTRVLIRSLWAVAAARSTPPCAEAATSGAHTSCTSTSGTAQRTVQ